jgi:hypothetical protein
MMIDVRALVSNDDLLNTHALAGFRTYNTEQMIAVDVPGASRKVLVTSFNQVDENSYFDPTSQQVVVVDHIQQVCCLCVVGRFG